MLQLIRKRINPVYIHYFFRIAGESCWLKVKIQQHTLTAPNSPYSFDGIMQFH